MDNPKTLATLSIQDNGKRRIKTEKGEHSCSQRAHNWIKKKHLQARDTDGRFVRNIGDQVFHFGNVYIQV